MSFAFFWEYAFRYNVVSGEINISSSF